MPLIALALLGIAAVLETYDVEKSITGMPVYDTTLNKVTDSPTIVAGTYAIRPSFSVDLEYDLNVYDRIQQLLIRISNKCAQEADKETCVNNEVLLINLEPATVNLKERLRIGCYEEAEGIFMDFLDYVSNCSSSSESDCACDHQYGEGSFKLVSAEQGTVLDAEVGNSKYSTTIKDIKLLSPLILSGTNHLLARDREGALVAVRKGELAKQCAPESYQRKTYTFCYATGKKLITADKNNKIIEQEHKIKFALEFP